MGKKLLPMAARGKNMTNIIIADVHFNGADSRVLLSFENVPVMLVRPKSKRPGIPPVDEQQRGNRRHRWCPLCQRCFFPPGQLREVTFSLAVRSMPSNSAGPGGFPE